MKISSDFKPLQLQKPAMWSLPIQLLKVILEKKKKYEVYLVGNFYTPFYQVDDRIV